MLFRLQRNSVNTTCHSGNLLLGFTRLSVLLTIQSATKLVDTLRPKGAFGHFTDFKRGKESFSLHPLHAMLCRCSSYLQKTTNTPTLNGGEGEGVWILLFSKVTLFEYSAWKKILISRVDDSSSVIWIPSPQKHHLPIGQVKNKIHSSMAKFTSCWLLDTPFFARWLFQY